MSGPDAGPSSPDEPRSIAGRRIVLGVTGGIAAYKAVEVCRRLVDAGAHVVPGAHRRRHALRRRGHLLRAGLGAGADALLGGGRRPSRTPDSARAPTLVVVAPATARLLGRYAAGISDDLLTATLLATRAPVRGVPGDAHRDVGAPRRPGEPGDPAPAGRASCWRPARGTPGRGRHRAGAPGRARAEIVEAVGRVLDDRLPPGGPTRTWRASLLVSAGGHPGAHRPRARSSRNRSSGKQGHALAAEAARRRGATVMLVTDVATPGPRPRVVAGRRRRPSMDGGAVLRASRPRPPTSWSWRPRWPTSRPKAASGHKLKQGRRPARDRARADARHPRRAGAPPPAGPGAGGLRRRDRRTRIGPGRGQAAWQGGRPAWWPTTSPRPGSASSTTPTP